MRPSVFIISSRINVGNREIKGRALVNGTLGPHAASMTMNNPLNGSQPYSRAFKRFRLVQPLKNAKQLVHVLHIETGSVVPDKYGYFLFIFAGATNLDFGPGPVAREL
jgi:hypothetical protein